MTKLYARARQFLNIHFWSNFKGLAWRVYLFERYLTVQSVVGVQLFATLLTLGEGATISLVPIRFVRAFNLHEGTTLGPSTKLTLTTWDWLEILGRRMVCQLSAVGNIANKG